MTPFFTTFSASFAAFSVVSAKFQSQVRCPMALELFVRPCGCFLMIAEK